MTDSTSTTSQPDNVRAFPADGQGRLTTPTGEQLPVRTFERGQDVMLVVLVETEEHAPDDHVDAAKLEYTSMRGVVRLHGEAVFEDRSLIRFHTHGTPEVEQRRSFVRVTAPKAVRLETEDQHERYLHAVDLSGGGMLLADAENLEAGETVRFTMGLGDNEPAITGEATVVGIRDNGKRALEFARIDEHDRQRLIRYVFECMRNARAKTRGDYL